MKEGVQKNLRPPRRLQVAIWMWMGAPTQPASTAGTAAKQASGSRSAGNVPKKPVEEKLKLDIELPAELRQILVDHVQFLNHQNTLRSDALVS